MLVSYAGLRKHPALVAVGLRRKWCAKLAVAVVAHLSQHGLHASKSGGIALSHNITQGLRIRKGGGVNHSVRLPQDRDCPSRYGRASFAYVLLSSPLRPTL